MPTFDVTAPNGKVFRVDAPEGATQEQAIAYVATEVYPRFLEENKPKPERGIGQLFTQGVSRGFAQTGVLLGDYLPAMLGRGVEAAGEATGIGPVQEAGKSFAERQLREAAQSELEIAKKYPREFESYEQITGPVSAARYAAEALGEGLPTLLPGLVTGGAGAVAARGLATAGGRAAATFGATAAGSAAQTVPEAYASLLRETGKEEIGTALVAGGINAALESVMPASVLSKLSGPAKDALVGSVKRRLGLGFAEGAAMEGLTEGMQEAVNKAAVTFVDENKEFFTSQNWKEILDNAIRGAIVGGTVSGATNVAFGRQEQATPGSGKPIDEVFPPEGQQPAPAEPTPAEPTPAEPTPAEPTPAEPTPAEPTPAEPTPAEPTPAEPTPAEPTPAEPTPAEPTPAEPTPAEPTPAEPTPAEPTPAEPTPAEPTPAEPTPAEPTPAEPTPAEPTPAEPTPAEPTPAEPTPAEPTPAPPLSQKPEDLYKLPSKIFISPLQTTVGGPTYNPVFSNDIEKALYSIHSRKIKKQKIDQYDAAKMFLEEIGLSKEEITKYGSRLAAHLGELADTASPGAKINSQFLSSKYAEGLDNLLMRPMTGPVEAPTPLIPAPPGVVQKPSRVDISPRSEAILNKELPGLLDVARTLIQGLYPGAHFSINTRNMSGAYGMASAYLPVGNVKVPRGGRPEFMLTFNVNSIKAAMPGGYDTTSYQSYLTKTFFHELSHPLEWTWISSADDKTFQAVIRQYVRERNPSSMERFALLRALRNPKAIEDPNFTDDTLKAAGLTREQFEAFRQSDAKKIDTATAGTGVTKSPVGGDYQRSFSEWIAEQGARWFAKELKGAVPKTTYEKFQKTVLDHLRGLYQRIAELLGIQPTPGAFEELLRDVYGRRAETPFQKATDLTRPGGKEVIRTKQDNFGSNIGLAPTQVSSTAQEPAPAPAAGKQTQLVKSWQDAGNVIGRGDESMTGMVGSFMRRLVGANPGESYGRAFARNVVNSNIPFLERAELRNLGKLIEGMMNASGRVMGLVTIGPMGYSQANKNFFYHTGKDANSLIDIFREIGTKNADQAQIVFLAMREQALRRDKIASQGALSPLPPGITRMSDQELQNIVDSADPAVRNAAERFQRFNDRMIEMSVQTGLIPRELGEKFKTMMYTPMYRLQAEAMKGDPNIALSQDIYDALRGPTGMNAFTRKVGELAVGGPVYGNLYENILSNYNAIVSAAVRNVAYQETANTLTKLMRDGGDTTIAEVFDSAKPDQDSIRFRVNGQDKHLVIHDPAMFQAIAALSPQQKGAFIKAASRFTDLLRKGVTAAPPFQLRNLIRGLVELKVKTGMPVFDILRGTLDGARDTLKKGDGYRDIVGKTGFGGFGFGSGAGDMSNYMNRVYREKELSWGEWQKYPNAFARLFDRLEGLGEVTEMAPRIAYYNYLRRQGMSDQDAAWEAVNLVNYHRHGTGNGILGNVVSNLIPLTPFLTARIQGLYRLVESGTAGAPKNLIGNGFVGIPAAIVSRGLMVMAINAGVNMMYGDDDWYKKLSVKDRLANMYVKVGDVVIALPRAYEVGELFGALPTLVMDSIRKENGSDIASGVGQFMMKTFLIEPVPQVVKPLVELYANKNFFTGLPIENLSDKRSPKEERFDEYTSSFAKMAGQVTKYVELSPKQVDTLIRGYLGTMSTLFLGTVDSLMGSAGTKPQGVFGDPNSVAGVVGNLTGVASILKTESQLNNKFVGDFYEIKDKVTQIVTSMNDAAIRRDTDTVKARLEEMPQAKAIYTAFNSVAARLTEVNRQMEAVRGQRDMPPEKKVELLEKLRTIKGQLAQQAVQAAERAGVTR